MDYETFISEITENLKEELEENIQVEVREVLQTNGSRYMGIAINKKGIPLQPVIPVELLFVRFQNGASMKECVHIALEIYENHGWGNSEIGQVSEAIRDWGQIKGKIYPSLVLAETNRELLETLVYRLFLDFAVCCDVRFGSKEESMGRVRVNRDMLKIWNISEEELWRQADENMAQDGYEVLGIEELLGE